jgi:hypothetical protein
VSLLARSILSLCQKAMSLGLYRMFRQWLQNLWLRLLLAEL